MWISRLKVTAATALAVAVLAGLFAVWRDAPKTYDVSLRVPLVTAYARASPRHVVVGGWGSADGPGQLEAPIWQWGPVQLGSVPRDRSTEREAVGREVNSGNGSWCWGEFGFLRGNGLVSVPSCRELMLPTWLACALGLTPLSLSVATRMRRARRVAGGACPACGYDLRATPGRCPECGAVPTAAASPA